jgi:dihydrofolate reductase
MSGPKWKAVVAMASNRVIGRSGGLPWRLPEDLKWFKKLTLGHPVVMGRKTMESLPRPLPGRRNVVVSRALTEVPAGFERTLNLTETVERLQGESAVSVIGGAQIYEAFFPLCEEVFLSYVFHPYEGDTRLPEFEADFALAEVLYRDADFELRRYLRKSPLAESGR